ncbi:hypothetical protein [Thioclava sp.]|uniref:hypothetical protein n=1 Tax=Thioclava sp. TaxID=1933450 RepID=UPI003AA94867
MALLIRAASLAKMPGVSIRRGKRSKRCLRLMEMEGEMQGQASNAETFARNAVAIKAFSRIAEVWKMSAAEAAGVDGSSTVMALNLAERQVRTGTGGLLHAARMIVLDRGRLITFVV